MRTSTPVAERTHPPRAWTSSTVGPERQWHCALPDELIDGLARLAHQQPPEQPITELRLSPKAFAADPALTPLARASRTEIKVGLSMDAQVHFRVRHDPPRAHGGPAPEYPHVFRRQLDKGQDSVSFTVTLGNRTFSPGRYLLFARARDPANQASERVSAKFRIKD